MENRAIQQGFTVYSGGKEKENTARLVSENWQRHAYFMAGYLYVKEREHEEREIRRARRLAYMRQRGYGALTVALGVISVPLLDMDATAALLFVPLGLYVMFTRQLLTEESEGRL